MNLNISFSVSKAETLFTKCKSKPPIPLKVNGEKLFPKLRSIIAINIFNNFYVNNCISSYILFLSSASANSQPYLEINRNHCKMCILFKKNY